MVPVQESGQNRRVLVSHNIDKALKEGNDHVTCHVMVGWMDGWMIAWMNGWMVGWMDGWMVDLKLSFCP